MEDRSTRKFPRELRYEVAPTLQLVDILSEAAFRYHPDSEKYDGSDVHGWFNTIPGSTFMMESGDYPHIDPVDDQLLGIIHRLEDALSTALAGWQAALEASAARGVR